jgi:hypothetical protein
VAFIDEELDEGGDDEVEEVPDDGLSRYLFFSSIYL